MTKEFLLPEYLGNGLVQENLSSDYPMIAEGSTGAIFVLGVRCSLVMVRYDGRIRPIIVPTSDLEEI